MESQDDVVFWHCPPKKKKRKKVVRKKVTAKERHRRRLLAKVLGNQDLLECMLAVWTIVDLCPQPFTALDGYTNVSLLHCALS